jgi:hypothetical protein
MAARYFMYVRGQGLKASSGQLHTLIDRDNDVYGLAVRSTRYWPEVFGLDRSLYGQ